MNDEPFFSDVLARSKALDQKDLALLASSKSNQKSIVLSGIKLGLLTAFLQDALKEGDAPLTLETTFEQVRKPLAELVARLKANDEKALEKELQQLAEKLKAETDEAKQKKLQEMQAKLQECSKP